MCSLSSKMLGKNSSAVDETQVQKLFFRMVQSPRQTVNRRVLSSYLDSNKTTSACLTSRVCFDQKGTKFGLVME